MVVHNPLHGSGRAALLQLALALGNNAKPLPDLAVGRCLHGSLPVKTIYFSAAAFNAS